MNTSYALLQILCRPRWKPKMIPQFGRQQIWETNETHPVEIWLVSVAKPGIKAPLLG